MRAIIFSRAELGAGAGHQKERSLRTRRSVIETMNFKKVKVRLALTLAFLGKWTFFRQEKA
jgi:hypothetical protein